MMSMEFGKDHGGHRLCSIVIESMVTWRPDGAWECATVDCCAQGDSDRAPHLGAPGEAWQLEGGDPAQTKDSVVYISVAMVPATLDLGWAGCEYASPGDR